LNTQEYDFYKGLTS